MKTAVLLTPNQVKACLEALGFEPKITEEIQFNVDGHGECTPMLIQTISFVVNKSIFIPPKIIEISPAIKYMLN